MSSLASPVDDNVVKLMPPLTYHHWQETMTLQDLIEELRSAPSISSSNGNAFNSWLVQELLTLAVTRTLDSAFELLDTSSSTSRRRDPQIVLSRSFRDLQFCACGLQDLYDYMIAIAPKTLSDQLGEMSPRTANMYFVAQQVHRLARHALDYRSSYAQDEKDFLAKRSADSAYRLATLATPFLPLSLDSSLLAMERRLRDLHRLLFDFVGVSLLLFTISGICYYFVKGVQQYCLERVLLRRIGLRTGLSVGRWFFGIGFVILVTIFVQDMLEDIRAVGTTFVFGLASFSAFFGLFWLFDRVL